MFRVSVEIRIGREKENRSQAYFLLDPGKKHLADCPMREDEAR